MPQNPRVDLAQYATEAYLEYAMTTVTDRALPQVEDGLKPVQRRILYAMHCLKLHSPSKHVKSARVVGEVLGKYHPHGDTAAYDALVRMAQPFTLRYPLVDGQGNFGSRDGDSPAAMRYTECRLTPVATLLTQHLNPGPTSYVPNYDGSEHEPYLLSARLPLILLNGASGIAVGMACELPPHNISEVSQALLALIENPDLSCKDLMQFIPGPDFPDGALIISSPEEILAAYSTGKGSIRLRALATVEPLAKNHWRIAISQMPYQVSTKQILEELEALSNPKIAPGKKNLSPTQIALKTTALQLIESASDESDKSTPVRLTIYPSSPKTNPEDLLAFLFSNTSLECNFSINNTLIGLDGNPSVMPLPTILSQWLIWRRSLLEKKLKAEHADLAAKHHILQGRLLAFINISEVIQTIRSAPPSPPLVQTLMTKFNLSVAQAQDILDMRLRQLQRLEGLALEQEIAKTASAMDRISKILNSKNLFNKELAKEISSDTQAFSDERRTQLAPSQRSSKTTTPTPPPEPMLITLSTNGIIKGWRNIEPSFKTGDSLALQTNYSPSHSLIAISLSGRTFSIPPQNIPTGRTEGAALFSLITLPPKDKIIALLSLPSNSNVLFITQTGFALTAPVEAFSSSRNQKTGKQLTDDPLLQVIPIASSIDNPYLYWTSQQPAQALALSTIPSRPSG